LENEIPSGKIVILDFAILRVLPAVLGNLLLEIESQLSPTYITIFVEIPPAVFEGIDEGWTVDELSNICSMMRYEFQIPTFYEIISIVSN